MNLNWIQIPNGIVSVGSSLEEIESANIFWRDRLLNPLYKKEFKNWLLKEYPKHEVHVRAFDISETLVTNELYLKYCRNNKNIPESITSEEFQCDLNHPVWGVSYEEVNDFCEWLSNELGYKVRLPTEIEWEYAARGETSREYPWGDEFDPNKCNTFESGIGTTTNVKFFENGKSFFGLYDMGGNVEEWVSTQYYKYDGGQDIRDDLTDVLGDSYPILKGGSFIRGGDLCRISRRHGPHPDPEFRFTGFRLVREKR